MDAFLAFLPYALLFLLCPLMMPFMHCGGSHGSYADGHAQHHIDDRATLARPIDASKDRVGT